MADRMGFIVRPSRRRGQYSMIMPVRSAVVSSSASRKIKDAISTQREEWQSKAYQLVGEVGEAAYFAHLTASTASLGNLRIVRWHEDVGEWVPEESPEASRVDRALVGPRGGKRELMRRGVLHYTIAGESHLVGYPVPVEEPAEPGSNGYLWEFLSTEELRIGASGGATRKVAGQNVDLPDESYLARWHLADPMYSDRPDSAIRHVMRTLEELAVLTQLVEAITKSRLASGLLFLPQDLAFPAADEAGEDDAGEEEIDEFTEALLTHMKAPVEDRTSAAGIVPLVVTGDGELGEQIRMIDLVPEGRANMDWARDLREEAIERLAAGLDAPPEILSGKGGLNHWCVDDQTEVLSDRGWVGIDDCDVGDMLLTLNHETGLTEWQSAAVVGRFDHDDELVEIEANRVSSLTTTNHRWPVLDHKTGERRWRTSETLKTNDAILVAAPSGDRPVEAKWSDALVEVAAWLWTEGHIRFRPGRKSPQVTIWQSQAVNADNVARIRGALMALLGPPGPLTESKAGRPRGHRRPPGWRERVRPDRPGMVEFILNAAAADVVVGLFSDPKRKVLDLSFIRDLTAAQLELFIEMSVRADGTVLPAGTIHLAQADPDRLLPLELAALLAGLSTSIYSLASGMTMLSISRQHRMLVEGKKINRVHYTGRVWCPTVANGTVFAKRDGRVHITGQTGYNIDHDFITKHVVTKGEDLADFLTVAYLRPMLVEFEGMDETAAATWGYEYDPSPLLSSEDEDATVRLLHSLGLISDEVAVTKSGFDVGDMPQAEEKRLRLALDLIKAAPVTMGKLLLNTIPGFEGVDTSSLGAEEGGGGVPAGGPAPETNQDIGGQEPSRSGEASLVDRLAVATDAIMERAMEKAGNRIVSLTKQSKADVTIRDRVAGVGVTQVLSTLTPADLRALGVTPETLFAGAWDVLSSRTRVWVRTDLELQGMKSFAADDAAALVANVLCEKVNDYAVENIHRGLPTFANGLRISDEVILEALGSVSVGVS